MRSAQRVFRTRGTEEEDSLQIKGTDLQKPGNVPLVADTHGNHVLKQPEERPIVPFLGPGLVQQPVELKEEAAGALWRTGGVSTTPGSEGGKE